LLYKWLFTTLTDITPSIIIDDYRTQLIYFSAILFIVSIIYNLIELKIRIIYNNIINELFKKAKEKILYSKLYELNKLNRSELLTFMDNFYVFETIYETILLTLPKTLLFLTYYFYNLYSFSLNTLLAILIINIITVVISRYIKNIKYLYEYKLFSTTSLLKKNNIEIINNLKHIKMSNTESKENNILENQLNDKNLLRINEFKINSYYSLFTENITDIIEVIMFYTLSPFVLSQQLKTIDLIYIGNNSGSMINYSISLYECFTIFIKYKPQLDAVDKILELKNESIKDTFNINDENLKINISDNKNTTNITFDKTKINILVGKNGSCKTSVIESLFDFNSLNQNNKMSINYLDINTINLRNSVAYVYQEPFIFDRNIDENILYGINIRSSIGILNNEHHDILDKYDINNWYYSLINKSNINLSGGEKKKLQIVNALLKDSKIYIFDEPTNNLDTNVVETFKNIIKKLVENKKLVIIISHDDRILTMDNTKIISMENIHNYINLKFNY
jgi:ABC-type bacteriocin/lantibiotic exporter with double-glycine peptidase domain